MQEAPLRDEDWFLSLLADGANQGLDLESELQAYYAWSDDKKRVASRAGFVSWISRAEPPLAYKRPKKREEPQVNVYAPPPDNWRSYLPIGFTEYEQWTWLKVPVNIRRGVLLAVLAQQKAQYPPVCDKGRGEGGVTFYEHQIDSR